MYIASIQWARIPKEPCWRVLWGYRKINSIFDQKWVILAKWAQIERLLNMKFWKKILKKNFFLLRTRFRPFWIDLAQKKIFEHFFQNLADFLTKFEFFELRLRENENATASLSLGERVRCFAAKHRTQRCTERSEAPNRAKHRTRRSTSPPSQTRASRRSLRFCLERVLDRSESI